MAKTSYGNALLVIERVLRRQTNYCEVGRYGAIHAPVESPFKVVPPLLGYKETKEGKNDKR